MFFKNLIDLMLSVFRFLKNHRDFMDHQPSSSTERPVIIFQKEKDAENRRSSFSQPKQGILSKPVSTASTWLGKRVRQQQKHDQHERQPFSQQFSVDAASEPTHNKNPPPLMTAASFDANSSIARTAYIPPPRIQPTRVSIFFIDSLENVLSGSVCLF